MSQKLPEIVWSKRSKRVGRIFLFFCMLNYAVRLFSISFSGAIGWYPKSFAASVDQALLWKVTAWVEFMLVNIVLLVVASLLIAFTVLRECLNLAFKRRKSVAVVRAKTILMLTTILAATLFVVFQIVVGGQGAFTGTRLGGFGLSGMMFLVGICTMASFLPAVGFAFDPKKTQMAFDQQERLRKGTHAERE